VRRLCSEGGTNERHGRRGDVERFIGYIVTFAVLGGMGVALPRWLEWRRSLIDRLLGAGKDTAHV